MLVLSTLKDKRLYFTKYVKCYYMLDLDRLRALSAVATYGSVSAAADVLHVTTSAVSQQVAKLERETGQKLLERNGRGVRLTDAAELLASHAERILDHGED